MVERALLTPRQVEFLELAARGFKGAEIAEFCYVAQSTVRMTLDNARERLGARTLAQAVGVAVELRIIEVDISAYVVAA